MRLDAEDVGFQIAPRLNAAGRLGQPQLAVELLVTDRPERAQELAQYIDGLNATRQTLERSIQLAAAKQAKEAVRPGRRRRAGAGRPRLASGRDRHRGRPAGRAVPPAGGDDLLGQGGHAAGDRLGPERAGLQPARGPGRVRRVSGGPRRPRGGGRPEDRGASTCRLPRRVLRRGRHADLAEQQRVAELFVDVEAPAQRVHAARRCSRSSGWPLSATAMPGRCCARPASRWPVRPSRWAAAGITWR